MTYQKIMIAVWALLAIAVALAIVAAVMFTRYNIPRVIGYLTGKTAREEVERIVAGTSTGRRAGAGRLVDFFARSSENTGRLTGKISQTGSDLGGKESAKATISPEDLKVNTTVDSGQNSNQNASESGTSIIGLDESGTSLLDDMSSSTQLLEDESGTQVFVGSSVTEVLTEGNGTMLLAEEDGTQVFDSTDGTSLLGTNNETSILEEDLSMALNDAIIVGAISSKESSSAPDFEIRRVIISVHTDEGI